jgi:hypothetical protein
MREIVSTAMSTLNEKWSILTAEVLYTNSVKSRVQQTNENSHVFLLRVPSTIC